MKLNRIHHIAVICSDYEASRHFYTDVLGLEIESEHYREERDLRGIAHEPIRTDEYTGKRFVFLSDPDGLPIELYEK